MSHPETSRKGLTPLIICIDVEPDKRAIDRHAREDWEGFEKTWVYLQGIRAPLERATGAPVHFSWFLRMDPQIEHVYGSAAWVMTRYGHLIAELLAAGDEVGLHPHLWRWNQERETWIVDFGSPEWVARCVHGSFAAFERCFGHACHSVRLGDGWMNDATMGLVEKLGARFDLTVEPGRVPDAPPESFTGSRPDYARAPRAPYRPAKRDFRGPGGWWRRRLWEIPLSTGRPAWAAAAIEERTRSAARPDNVPEEGGAAVHRGWHDRADQHFIEGWVYDAAHPDAIVAVDIFDDRTLIATLPANCFRPDLLRAGIGHGRHGFVFPVPDRLKDGKPHTIRVMVARTDWALHQTPKVIEAPRPEAVTEDYLPLNMTFSLPVFGGMLEAILACHRTAHLALVLRSNAGSLPVARANLEQSFEHILGHAETSRFKIATPAETIRLLHTG